MALIVLPLTALVLVFSLLLGKTYRATARVAAADTSGLFQTADPTSVQVVPSGETAPVRVLPILDSLTQVGAVAADPAVVKTLPPVVTRKSVASTPATD